MTAAIGGSATAGLAGTTAAETTTKRPDDMGKDTFLKLLVAQLRYQNPMNPTDGMEFLGQTAQFTMIEKLSELKEANDKASVANRALTSSLMLGKEVSATVGDGKDAKDVAGKVTAVKIDPTDGVSLVVNGVDVPLARVKEVKSTP